MTMTPCLPGDLLFFASSGDLGDTLISDWTNSPIVHVGIAISAVQQIAALHQGVMLLPINYAGVARQWCYLQHVQPAENLDNLHNALTWLIGQKGNLYGWGDIVNAALWKFEHAISITVGDHFDC